MSAPLLTIRCARRLHLVARVFDDPVNGPVIEVENYARNPLRADTWVPARFVMRRGSARRYGCPCGFSDMFDDLRLGQLIDAGYTEYVMPTGNIIGSQSRSAKPPPA